MSISSECNGYLQETKPFDLIKTDKARADQTVNTSVQALHLLCTMLEPFVPSFSAKIYNQLNLKRSQKQETLLETMGEDVNNDMKLIRGLVDGGHKIGQPAPIFRNIADEEVKTWRAQFAGKKEGAE